jgi:ATP-dependent exoDNAse (exonuclease V) beta subunit
VTASQSEITEMARLALGSPVVRRAVAGGRYWRELYVGAPFGARVLEGFIDLLIERPDGFEVVDYKTDKLSARHTMADLVQRYTPQAAAYALAVEEIVGRAVVACTFLFLGGQGAQEGSIEHLEQAKAQVRELLTAS